MKLAVQKKVLDKHQSGSVTWGSYKYAGSTTLIMQWHVTIQLVKLIFQNNFYFLKMIIFLFSFLKLLLIYFL